MPAMDEATNVILIGYRGSGKTTIGKLIADQLWKKFVDVDDETCKRFNGKTIAAIWQESGEPAWRKAEVAVTQELCARKGMVIGLGGGTLMQPGARQAVKDAQNTVRIYLKCEAQELHRRISADTKSAATRPALTQFGGGLEEIQAMLAQREPVYLEVADHVFDVTNIEPEAGLRHLIKRCL
jgi:shikimate kinase